MAQTTKRALGESLKKLLLQKPLNKITISDITEDCGINRMTFYYHFRDIYDLIEWVVMEDAERAIEGNRTEENWQKGMLNIFRLIQESRPFVMNLYHSISREQLETSLHRMLRDLVVKILEQQAAEMEVAEEDIQFIADFYRHAMTGILLDWVKGDMKENPEELVHRLDVVTRGNVRRALEVFQQERVSKDPHS